MIIFTDREIQRAWRQNKLAYENGKIKTNAHRLLLFYSVECGLKAVIMKRQRKNRTDLCQDIGQSQHNINRLLDCLSARKNLRLPPELNLTPLRENEERNCKVDQINQIWRYGGHSNNIKDDELEKKLINIVNWIGQELGNL
ncbi:MAG: hypothetical protein AB4062_17385 [Crocosphaera sp.]